MKKIKEFIKKIGNKKYCLLSLLLAGLLLFAIVGGLNGSKSAKTEVNAISAPATKNLDLNGVRYTYETSLKELKNNYGLFTHWYYNTFRIYEDSEGLVELSFSQQTGNYTMEELNNTKEILKNTFQLEFDDTFNGLSFSSNTDAEMSTLTTTFTFDNTPSQTDITGIKVNYDAYNTIPYIKKTVDLTSISVMYLNDRIGPNAADEEIINNCKIITYANYVRLGEVYIKFKKIDGYTPYYIWGNCNSINEEITEENVVVFSVPQNFENYLLEPFIENAIILDNINFLDNMISFEMQEALNEKILYKYKGNILLSQYQRDNRLLKDMQSNLGPNLQFKFNGGAIFGGNFENNKLINTFNFIFDINNLSVMADLDDNTLFNTNVLFTYYNIINTPSTQQYNTYTNQNQLLYLPKAQTLKQTYENKVYDALSAQVEDVLYNVNYLGNIEEEEFNQKVQEDFENLAKTTGLGAFIGLIIGILFGVPGLGALWGAVGGFFVGIIPLIIDALQSIFGKNFLSGLYNFFKSITNFFVNIVDSIFNFLISIITNPFILVTIIIVVLLYVFVVRPKIK